MALEETTGLPAVAAQEPVYRLRDGVGKVRRQNATILVAPGGRSIRISAVGDDLMPLLATGSGFADLVAHLERRHPASPEIARKLRTFLAQLETAGLLDRSEGRPAAREWRKYPLFDPDPAAAAIARAIAAVPAWISWTLLAGLIAASLAAIAALVLTDGLPPPMALFQQFDAVGLLIFLGGTVLVHESAHAVACRLAGARVGSAGIILHNGIMPGPYVETTDAYRVQSRFARFWIPAAGPLINFLSLGAAASWLWLVDPASTVAAYVFLLSALFVILDTNPLMPSDGSRMLEAAFGDDLLRRSALSTRRSRLSDFRHVAWYRIACSMHLQGFAVLIFFWWMASR